ncbi:CAP domain-containing protein [Deinococcus maricopensis]|uniref:SCP-like extracellular n=1 Tax=Deinococcus maricopensis (strain DSM 21211 / LMG 22137 / NRRL B-23946 / LB-34) TaxID=709986 RepID=E8U705_DEIML|nr:CAP domain-containing protein [Deinococcus maricopensis]ADV66844.1 SCP-like extracellular [Deinococcus maricopensis DSM 21211]
MSPRHLLPIALTAALAACSATPTPAPSDTTHNAGGTPAQTTPATAEAQAILNLVNAVRKTGATCPTDSEHTQANFGPATPLTLNAKLTIAAQQHSDDMATRNYFSHNSLEGVTPQQRMVAAGYTNWSVLGENIAAGYGGAQATFKAWMGSPSHCPNIMDPDYRELGVGYGIGLTSSGNQRDYWTQDFGARQ